MQSYFYYVLVAGGSACLSTFLRGFQNKNVAAGLKGMAFITGYLMNIADILLMSVIAYVGANSIQGALRVGVISALGAAIGYYISIVVHDRLLMERREAERKRQAAILQEKINKRLQKKIGLDGYHDNVVEQHTPPTD